MTNKNAWISALVLSLCACTASNAEVPVTVDVIRGQDIEAADIDSIETIIGRLPRVPVRPATGSQSGGINVRGAGDGTLVLVDGIVVRRPFNPDPVDYFPTDLVDRVEIIKGPAAATLYGQKAAAGVVNVITNNRYSGSDVGGSQVLPGVMDVFNSHWLSVQSTQHCDTTQGEPRPGWTFEPSLGYDFGKIGRANGTIIWGGKSLDITPREYEFSPFEFSKTPAPNPASPLAYVHLDNLIKRIEDHPSASDEDKGLFVAGLWYREFLSSFGGGGLFTDNAFAAGHFDPEAMFQAFQEWVVDGGVAAAAASQTATTEDVGYRQLDPTAPYPFNKYINPPDYAFDISQCTDPEDKKNFLTLLDERSAATVQWLVQSEGLRSGEWSRGDNSESELSYKEGRKLEAEKNDKLKELWVKCTTGAESQTADVESTPSGDAAQAQSDAGSGDQCADPISQFGPLLENYGFGAKVQYSFWRYTRGADDVLGKEWVPGLGVNLHPAGTGEQNGVPGSAGAVRCTEPGAGAGSSRGYTNLYGFAEFQYGSQTPFGSSVQFGPLGEIYIDGKMDFSQNPMWQSLRGTSTAWNDRTFQRDGDEFNWKIGARYDVGKRFSVVSRNIQFEKKDQVVQQFPNLGGIGANFEDLAPEIRDSIPEPFRDSVGEPVQVGPDLWLPFAVDEYKNLDLGTLDSVKGSSGWTEDTCGKSALPPEAIGYTPAAESPVKSVDDQWALDNVGITDDLPLPEANATPVVVGIIDTGIDWNHLDFAWESLWRNNDEIPDNGIDDDRNGYVDDLIGWDFVGMDNKPWDSDGHGTFVAGLIAASVGNDVGIDGINPHARIMVLKALNSFGRTRASLVAQAIVYGADNGAQILNLSVAGPGFPRIVQDAVDYAEAKGVLIVMAAGNRAENIDNAEPGRLERVMTVAATGPDDKRAAFSNVGSAINVSAPGIDIVSLRARRSDFLYNSAETTYVPGDAFLGDDNRYYRSTGTSFATPIVSGVASLVWAARPELTHRQVQRIVEQSARDVETPGRDSFTGYGIVDAKAALEADPEFYIHAVVPAVQLIEADYNVFLQVIGVADADQFASARVEVGEGDNPDSWTNVGTLPATVPFGELARIPSAQLRGAATWTVRLVVEHQNGRNREARYVVDVN